MGIEDQEPADLELQRQFAESRIALEVLVAEIEQGIKLAPPITVNDVPIQVISGSSEGIGANLGTVLEAVKDALSTGSQTVSMVAPETTVQLVCYVVIDPAKTYFLHDAWIQIMCDFLPHRLYADYGISCAAKLECTVPAHNKEKPMYRVTLTRLSEAV